MSTWSDPSYRIDALKALAGAIPPSNVYMFRKLLNFHIDEPSENISPKPQVLANIPISSQFAKDGSNSKDIVLSLYPEYNTKVRGVWRNLDFDGADEQNKTYFKSYKECFCGLQAVYKVTNLILNKVLVLKDTHNFRSKTAPARDMLRAALRESKARAEYCPLVNLKEALTKEDADLLGQAHSIFSLKLLRNWRKVRQKVEDVEPNELPRLSNKWWTEAKSDEIVAYLMPSGVIIKNKRDKCVYLLAHTDLQRISKILRGVALYRTYFRWVELSLQYGSGISIPSVVGVAERLIRLLESQFNRCSYTSAQDIAAYWAYECDTFLVLLAESEVINSIDLQLAKHSEKHFDLIGTPYQAIDYVEELPIENAYDLLHLGRCLPCPDFCLHSALRKQEAIHSGMHTMGTQAYDDFQEHTEHHRYKERSKIYTAYETAYPDFKARSISNRAPDELYQVARYMLASHYAKVFGFYPGVIKDQYATLPWIDDYREKGVKDFHDMYAIDLTGVARFEQFHSEMIFEANDKTCAPSEPYAIKNAEALRRIAPSERNYLLKLMHSGMTYQESMEYCRTHDAKHLVAFKPEAKKRDSRLFYMANPYFRALISNLEANIARQIKNSIGVLITKDPVAANRLVQHSVTFGHTAEDVGYMPMFISFDMAKWSPQMPWHIIEIYRDVFTEWFGEPHLQNVFNFMEEAEVCLNSHGIVDSYRTLGTNFEGFNGKLLTKFHVDVMYLAMYYVKKYKLTNRPVYFGAFIDDGITKVLLSKIDYRKNAKITFAIVELIYEACGLRFSYDKTLISNTLAHMLNEVYVLGQRITAGVKVFLKITPREDAVAPTLQSKIAQLMGTAQGAVKAGCAAPIAYFYYLVAALVEIAIYDRNIDWTHYRASLTYLLFAPISLGGLGACSYYNIRNTMTQEPEVDCGRLLSFEMEPYDDWTSFMLEQTMSRYVQTDPLKIARSNGSLLSSAKYHSLEVFTLAVREGFERRKHTFPAIQALIPEDLSAVEASYVSAVTNRSSTGGLENLLSLYKAHPIQLYDRLSTRLSRPATVVTIFGFRWLKKVKGKQRVSTLALIEYVRNRLA